MTIIEDQRKHLALNAIMQALGTQAGDDSVNLFIEHHLEELPQGYWQKHLGSGTPERASIISLLQLHASWGEENIEYFDFTLPDEVTDYVISVRFDSTGRIESISMES
ncbi:MAG: DUF2004 domain-containing protein [Giesbergeria sp.]